MLKNISGKLNHDLIRIINPLFFHIITPFLETVSVKTGAVFNSLDKHAMTTYNRIIQTRNDYIRRWRYGNGILFNRRNAD